MTAPAGPAPKILFLVRALNRGGAERQLVALASGLRQHGWPVSVACFYAGGPFQADLEQAGVPVIDLQKGGRWSVFRFVARMFRLFRESDADIVHGYLPVPNMLALLARVAHRHTRIVWGVRASNVDLSRYDWLSRLTFRTSCLLARQTDCIICNSFAGREYHAACGYPRNRMLVIPNGIDINRFQYDAAGRGRVRREWDIADDEVLVGLVGRLDPMKDHRTFIEAAALLVARDRRWRFVCVGDGSDDHTAKLHALAAGYGLEDRLAWVGARDDVPAVYSALDVASSSSSFGEGFPNTVAEAMACGLRCVVTNVGDSAVIVGSTGIVVPPRDAPALADGLSAWRSHYGHEQRAQTNEPNSRIVGNFSIVELIDRTEQHLLSLLS